MPEDKVRVSGRSPAQWQRKDGLSLWSDVALPVEFQAMFSEIKIEFDEEPNPNNPTDVIGKRKYKKKRIFNLETGYRITFVIEENGDPAQFILMKKKKKARSA
jgi:hypothetical protein